MGHTLVATDIMGQLRLERQKDGRAQIDVTRIVSVHIPVGTDASAARTILESNGFKIYKRDLPSGSYRLMGSITEKSAIPVVSYEYRIVLTIKNGTVASVFARIFLHTL
jgi:hypothetical protein